MRLGIIADTHGYFDPRIAQHFASVAQIIHAGDIGAAEVIAQLERIAPVVAVHGNVDAPPLSERYAHTEHVTVAGLRLMVTHIAGLPERMPRDVRMAYERLRPDAVICGHSHQRQNEIADGGTLFFNPGAAGRQGFHRARSIGLIDVRDGALHATHITLTPR